ncbi:MAG: class I SAM-dependent methyltransferase [Acidobacteriia bacterium]|nr:class I SAM-dependent methyltransferase [Terriglobia bacterium]
MPAGSLSSPIRPSVPHARSLLFVSRMQARLMRYFRSRRHQWLTEEFEDCRTVIDVGGRASMWSTVKLLPRVTIVNVEGAEVTGGRRFEYIHCDARSLEFGDRAFDLAFSNSVIEHVGTLEDQKQFAEEMMRVGRRIYCQTPNRWFPVEFHFLGAFVHWLPRKCFSYFVHRYLTLRGLLSKPTREQSWELRKSIRLLTRRELAALFPGCTIRTERVLGIPKSFTAWR